MEQMQIPADMQCAIDYGQPELPRAIRELHPVLFKEGDSYCCLLGPDPQAGIFGCGATPGEALTDWDEHLRERMKTPDANDEVAAYVKGVLKDA
ncbi:hypothetical protein [Chitinophaga pinensis]|uniref:Uncharacterized protein n=1 Tax=Chitinophaga pinensis (strain ATCC 43595 / DSM 2588 / LMG 13176 / NBRC 15968 / NCIMB 11800 / UQM 2034) TaxID=485918 RepID=A0A979GR58_CHIPD|nr:hypothetical protein [Chitinophaga pinensis]ACU60708.1 hypothetical protein Cpin_3241 [Chitinophaga pinensis DSM 2588]